MADPKENKPVTMDTGQIALRCAQFFMSLGQSCLQFYHKYNKEKQRKTKMIKKNQRQKPKIMRRADGGDGEEFNEDIKKKLPKKPLTAYIIYFQQKKPNFVEKYPGLNLSDLTKLIAKQWKEIDNNQRKPYLQQAQQDRKRYQTEIRQFKQKYGPIAVNPDEQQQNGLIQNENEQSSNPNNPQRNQQQLMNQKKRSDQADQNQNAEDGGVEESGENDQENQNQNGGDLENENQERMEGEGDGSQNEDSEDKEDQD